MAVFHVGRSIPIELDLEMLVFEEGGKPENLEKNRGSKDENQQQTQPTYVTGSESHPGHIGERRALSPMRHPYSPRSLVAVTRIWHYQYRLLLLLTTPPLRKKLYSSMLSFPAASRILEHIWKENSSLWRSNKPRQVYLWRKVICKKKKIQKMVRAFSQQKQWGLQNKVSSSLVTTHRPRHEADNCKMV